MSTPVKKTGAKGRKASASKSKGKASQAKSKTAGPKAANNSGGERLRPGQLDALVLAYMKKHRGVLPLTPTKVAHGINRSSGAVANCLGRLEREKKVRRAGQKPRRYDLTASTK